MSQIRLTSSSSGVITVATPTTSANRTITLPDETGTLQPSPSSSKVAFRVVNSTSVTIVNAATNYSITLNTDSGTATNYGTCFNLGNHFNTTNYKFTAPVTGYYMLAYTLYLISNSDSARYGRLEAKNQDGDNVFISINTVSDETGNSDYTQLNYSGVTLLNANDTIENFAANSYINPIKIIILC
jgi:hypothetical protein